MSDKSNTVALVIDTSRRNLNNCFGPIDKQESPDTSYSNTSCLWSASASTTPSTGFTSNSAYGHDLSNISSSTGPESIISKIDEYLADLQVPITSSKSAKSIRRSLTININRKALEGVEQALPSSPDALHSGSTHTGTPPPSLLVDRPRRLSLPSSPLDFEEGFTSPLFYRCFAKPDGSAVLDDAAPFPYTPSRESVCLEPGYFGASIFRRLELHGCVLPDVLADSSRSASQSISRPVEGPHTPEQTQSQEPEREAEVELPSIRFDAAEESDVPSDSDEVGTGSETTPHFSPLSIATSVSSCDWNGYCQSPASDARSQRGMMEPLPRDGSPKSESVKTRPAVASSNKSGSERSAITLRPSPSLRIPAVAPSATHQWTPLIRPTVGAHRGLSRSASAGNLPRLSTEITPAGPPVAGTAVRRADSGSSGGHTVRFASATSASPPCTGRQNATTPSPRSPPRLGTPNTSPTSTQIIEGLRKMNKLKKILGEEVSSHISTTPHTKLSRGGNTMKPLPSIPSLPSFPLQRSQTTLAHSPIQVGARTMLGSYKPRDKKPCSASSGNDGRPSTARDARCTCPNCAKIKQASRHLLTGLNGGERPRLRIETKRPNTSSSLKRSA